MGLWFSMLECSLFLLVTEACEVSIFMTRLVLEFLGWTLETFNVIWISTLLTYLLVLVYIRGIKALPVTMLPVTCIILVTGWSRLNKGLPLLVLAWWEVCALMSHQIDLSHLGVPCHLLDVPDGHLWALYLLCKLPDLACRKLVQICITVIDCLGDKLFIFVEKTKDVPVKYLGCFWGYLAKAPWVCTALYHSSSDLLPSQKLVSKSNLALTSFSCGLLNSSYFPRLWQALALHQTSSRKHTGPCQNHHCKQ